jgi:hypothetical protein
MFKLNVNAQDYIDLWKGVNAPEFLAKVKINGPAAGRIYLPQAYRRVRFAPDEFRNVNVPRARVEFSENGQRTLFHIHGFSGWKEADEHRHFARLMFGALFPDGRHWTWPVEAMRRDHENNGTESLNTEGWDGYRNIWDVIFRGKTFSPAKNNMGGANELYIPGESTVAFFWIAGWEGSEGTERRSDLMPFRFPDLRATEPPKPPPPPKPGEEGRFAEIARHHYEIARLMEDL